MKQTHKLIIVSGLSGSGKSTALQVFEDMGYYTVDGAPISFLPVLCKLYRDTIVGEQGQYKGLVFGLETRQKNIIEEYQSTVKSLLDQNITPAVIFLGASNAELLKRYATTRRPHPLEKEGLGLEKAICEESLRLAPLQAIADSFIDTSFFSIHDLRRYLQNIWKDENELKPQLHVHFISFGFKYGTPAEADMVFDLRFLRNPYFDAALKSFSGKTKEVQEYVLNSEPGLSFYPRLHEFLNYLLEVNEQEGRFRLSIAIGCTGGHHRSVATVEKLAESFHNKGYQCTIEHRHLALNKKEIERQSSITSNKE